MPEKYEVKSVCLVSPNLFSVEELLQQFFKSWEISTFENVYGSRKKKKATAGSLVQTNADKNRD